MAATNASVTLNPAGGMPEVEVVFGQVQVGFYRSFLSMGDAMPDRAFTGKLIDAAKSVPGHRRHTLTHGQSLSPIQPDEYRE